MSDAIVAKVMNSTVGSNSLKSLDTILKEHMTTVGNNSADRLFNSLKSSTKLVGSDDVLYTYTGDWAYVDYNQNGTWMPSGFVGYETSSYIKVDTSGTIVFRTIQRSDLTDDYNATEEFRYAVIDGSGNIISKADQSIVLPHQTTVEIKMSANVTAGNKYKIAIARKGGNYPDRKVDICGKTIILAPSVTVTT